MALDEKGCENLVNAIYARAATDYIKAVICNDKIHKKEIEEFFVSGAYSKNIEEGEYIKNKCLKEIKICKKFIDEFIKSDLQKILIDEKLISIPVLSIIKNTRYKNKLTFKTITEKVYLCKKTKTLTN